MTAKIALLFLPIFSFGQPVYNPSRLKLIKLDITATGVVEKKYKEKDGDWHVQLRTDKRFLNQANIKKQNGCLVIEIVCANEVTQEDAKKACECYQNRIPIPKIGDSVSVRGNYILDLWHGWREIHPITELIILKRKPRQE